MANAFKLVTDTGVGASAATIYTCPSSTETTIIGLSIANIVTSQIEIDVQLENNDGDNVYIIKGCPGSRWIIVGCCRRRPEGCDERIRCFEGYVKCFNFC